MDRSAFFDLVLRAGGQPTSQVVHRSQVRRHPVSEIGRRAAMERAHVRGYLRRHGIGDPKKSAD